MNCAGEEEVEAVNEAEWIGSKPAARFCLSRLALSLIASIKYYFIRDY